MTPHPLRAEPMLFVTDLPAALTFWSRLGFAERFRWGDPPTYAGIARGGAHLALRHVDRHPFTAAFRAETPQALSAVITLDDAEALAREFTAAGFPVTLRDEPWGAQTFILADPDGNLILVAGRG
ncbi:VOC family protein [Roseomonas sp. CCTCC AB2023176]|uniref:VOC family protein n=1 Tax=Roseomonas sp. CCTCC AB2023176 TaxID=3342640 RepID=UPI0035DE8A4C